MQQKTKAQSPLHFRRKELKYVLPDSAVPELLERLDPYTQADPFLVSEDKGRTKYPVTSLYFDSIDLQAYHEKVSGILARRKVRLRTYHTEFTERRDSFLEIKRRHDSVISKDRLSLAVGHLDETVTDFSMLTWLLRRVDADAAVHHEAEMLQNWFNLQPTALVQYERIPRVAKEDRRFRITVDANLCGSWKPVTVLGPQQLRQALPGKSIIELKFDHSVPAWLHEIIQSMNMQIVSSSKYTTVVDALRPVLPNHF